MFYLREFQASQDYIKNQNQGQQLAERVVVKDFWTLEKNLNEGRDCLYCTMLREV